MEININSLINVMRGAFKHRTKPKVGASMELLYMFVCIALDVAPLFFWWNSFIGHRYGEMA